MVPCLICLIKINIGSNVFFMIFLFQRHFSISLDWLLFRIILLLVFLFFIIYLLFLVLLGFFLLLCFFCFFLFFVFMCLLFVCFMFLMSCCFRLSLHLASFPSYMLLVINKVISFCTSNASLFLSYYKYERFDKEKKSHIRKNHRQTCGWNS